MSSQWYLQRKGILSPITQRKQKPSSSCNQITQPFFPLKRKKCLFTLGKANPSFTQSPNTVLFYLLRVFFWVFFFFFQLFPLSYIISLSPFTHTFLSAFKNILPLLTTPIYFPVFSFPSQLEFLNVSSTLLMSVFPTSCYLFLSPLQYILFPSFH